MNNSEEVLVNDFDADVAERKALIEEVKGMEDADMQQIQNLKKRWRRISYWESAYEDELEEEFEKCLDVFYAKQREVFKNAEDNKRDLIAKAKAVASSTKWNQAAEEMDVLMAQWKASGSAGRNVDDALWEEFNTTRQSFYDRRREYWNDRHAQFAKAKEIKEAIIVKAQELADSTQWQKTGNEFKTLMDEWKTAGSAGREHEDALWEKFNECRQKFYSARDAYYEELHGLQDKNYEAKKALVKRAEELAQAQTYSKEDTEAMKTLSKEWKEVGSCGKAKEDEIWELFRNAMDTYFNGLRERNNQRREQWRQRMIDARNRKQEMIQKQKNMIHRLEQDMVGLLGERAINETKEEIEDKKEFIKELEEQLADIEKTLEEK